ncbi:unnamed protein product [Rhizopus stolonifer]
MSKRQLEDTGFANVLRQKFKEDELIKQSVAQRTFERLMNAQRRPMEDATLETQKTCYRCSFLRDCDFVNYVNDHFVKTVDSNVSFVNQTTVQLVQL